MNALKKMLSKYADYSFQSSCDETPEWKSFCLKLKNALKKEIKEEYPDLELSSFSKGHFYISGFITRKSDNAVFYFCWCDVRTKSVIDLQMYRSARDLNDFSGGMNLYTKGYNLLAAISKAKNEFEK